MVCIISKAFCQHMYILSHVLEVLYIIIIIVYVNIILTLDTTINLMIFGSLI